MNEAELAELDFAVAEIEGLTPSGWKSFPVLKDGVHYRPSRDPFLAMRLLVKYELAVSPHMIRRADPSDAWWAQNVMENDASKTGKGTGPTPCIAICKAVVALKR